VHDAWGPPAGNPIPSYSKLSVHASVRVSAHARAYVCVVKVRVSRLYLPNKGSLAGCEPPVRFEPRTHRLQGWIVDSCVVKTTLLVFQLVLAGLGSAMQASLGRCSNVTQPNHSLPVTTVVDEISHHHDNL